MKQERNCAPVDRGRGEEVKAGTKEKIHADTESQFMRYLAGFQQSLSVKTGVGELAEQAGMAAYTRDIKQKKKKKTHWQEFITISTTIIQRLSDKEWLLITNTTLSKTYTTFIKDVISWTFLGKPFR